MEFITESNKDNVILFPKTIEYYQVQLTRMLESEQYSEAIELLQFLLQCQKDNHSAYEEWKVLLDWLQSQLSTLSDDHESDDSESSLLAKHVQEKMEKDANYSKKMLNMLLRENTMEKKFLALDQLVYMEDPQIDVTLIHWLENTRLHPLLQFKALQTLKLRGISQSLHIERYNEMVTLNIEETPLSYEDYPEKITKVLQYVQETSETDYPALSYFAEQTWKTFLSFIYGTSMYYNILIRDDSTTNIWAAALHCISMETMLGTGYTKPTFELYNITPDMDFQWEQAYRYLKKFVETAFQPY